MEITETARIKLVIDGAEAGKNELSKLRDSIDDLHKKRGEYERGTKEWNDFTKQIKEQEKAYRDVEKRIDVTTMTLSQLTQYQRELRKELRGLDPDSEGFKKVASRLNEVNARAAEVNSAIKVTNDEVKKQPSLWEQAKGAFTGFLAAFTLQAVVGYLKDLASKAWDTVNSFDRMHMALKNVSSSQAEYKENLQFLNQLSNNYGQNLGVITKAYTGFLASTKSTNLSLQEKQRIYESVIKAGSALTMSNEQIEGSLLAISQMFSKGNIQAEELRGQLGERLPGAFGIMAKALGVSEQQLNKMLEQGKVLAEDALPKFAKALEEAYGDKAQANLNTYQGSMNRLGMVVTNMFISWNEKIGVTRGVAQAINWVADNLNGLINVVKAAAAAFTVYLAATKGVAAAKAAWVLVEKAGLVIKGQAILALEGYTGMTIATTAAQVRATAAANSFNAALLKNPFGLVAVALSTLTAAYFLFRDETDKAKVELSEFQKGMAEAQAPIIAQQMAFNGLAKEVLSGTLSYEQQMSALKKLKDLHPEILKDVTDLETAEKKLNAAGKNVNSQNDYRLGKLKELKEEYPNQMKGIDTIKDAERELGKVMALVNGEFVKRIELASLAYKTTLEEEKVNKLIKERVELEQKLESASKKKKGVYIMTMDGGSYEEDPSDFDVLNKKMQEVDKSLQKHMARMDQYKGKSAEMRIPETLTPRFGFY